MRVELVGAGALIVAGETFRAMCLAVGGQWPSLMLDWLPAYLDLFGVGMLLAVASAWQNTTAGLRLVRAGLGAGPGGTRLLDRLRFPWACWATAAAAFVAVANLGLPVAPLYTQTLGLGLAREALYGAFAVLLVAPAVFGPQGEGAIRAALSWRPVVALGVVSYGIYLWHQGWVALWLRWTGGHLFALSLWRVVLFVVAMAVVSAAASWWGLERWLIHGTGRRVEGQLRSPWRRPRPADTQLAPPALAGAQQ